MKRFALAIGISGPNPSILQRIAGIGSMGFCGIFLGFTIWWIFEGMMIQATFGVTIVLGLLTGNKLITRAACYLLGFCCGMLFFDAAYGVYHNSARLDSSLLKAVMAIFMGALVSLLFYIAVRITYYHLEPNPKNPFKIEDFAIRYCIPTLVICLILFYVALPMAHKL